MFLNYRLTAGLIVLVSTATDKPLFRYLRPGEIVRLEGDPLETGIVEGTSAAGERIRFFYSDLIERADPVRAVALRSN